MIVIRGDCAPTQGNMAVAVSCHTNNSGSSHLVDHERRRVFVDLDLARLGVHNVDGRHAALLDDHGRFLAVVCAVQSAGS